MLKEQKNTPPFDAGLVVRRRESSYTRKRRQIWFLFEYDWLFLMNWITLPLSIKGKNLF